MLNARKFLILAVHEITIPAPFAVATTPTEEPDAYALADAPALNAIAKGINHANDLMTRHPWPFYGEYASTVAASE